jgi:hypothetical protein
MNWKSADREDLNRDRGILTKADREYLVGKSKIEKASHSERRARERIRNRLKNAILDMGLLFEHMERRDKEQVFVPDSDARSDALTANSHALALLLDGVGAHRLMQHTKPNKDPSEEALRHALELVGREHRYFIREVSLEVDADRIPENRLFRMLREGDKLSPESLRFLLELDEVDVEQVQESIRKQIEDE